MQFGVVLRIVNVISVSLLIYEDMLSTWVIVDMLLLAQTECVFNLCDHVEWNNPEKNSCLM